MIENFKFGLYTYYNGSSDLIPLAGVMASSLTSKAVRTVSEIQSYPNGVKYLLTKEDGVFKTSFPFPAELDVSKVAQDMLVGNNTQDLIYYQLNKPTDVDPDISLRTVQGNHIPFTVKYKQNDTSYDKLPYGSGEQTVRLYVSPDDVAGKGLLVSYRKSDPLRSREEELIDSFSPQYVPGTDWTLSVNKGFIVVTPVHTDLQNTSKLIVIHNAVKCPKMYMPNKGWTEDWKPLVRQGTLFTDAWTISTRYSTASPPPALVQDKAVQVIQSNLIKLSHSNISDTGPITVYYNGNVIENAVKNSDLINGYLHLTQTIPLGASVVVHYELDTSEILEAAQIDFNPHTGHYPGTGINEIANVRINYYLQPLVDGGELMYTSSDTPNVGYYERTGNKKTQNERWLHFASCSLIPQDTPDIVDIRQKNVGLDPKYKERSDWNSMSNWGYIDGRNVNHTAFLVRIPTAVYTDTVRAFFKTNKMTYQEAEEKATAYITNMIRMFSPTGVNLKIEYK